MRNFLLLTCVLCACLSSFAQTKHYVDQTAIGANNGTSWTDAFVDFQSAVAIADAGDTVFVAAGTHKPSVGPGSTRTRKFTLVNGVKYYGGFPNGGGTFAQRDFVLNRTILSGDIGTPVDSIDNCFVVVDATDLSNSTKVSGFTIERGYADSTGPFTMYSTVGGMYLGTSGSVVVDSCTFRNNFGRGGAGIYLQGAIGNLQLTGCTFLNNRALGSGAGACSSSPSTIINCTFTNNRSLNGAAICVAGSGNIVTITNCTFTGNTCTGGGGGGALNLGSSNTTTVTNSLFTGNSAANLDGGAIYKFSGTLSLIRCTFDQNTALRGGGVMSLSGSANMSQCAFTRNSCVGSSGHGGGAYINGGNSNIENTVFWFNTTTLGLGGGLYNNTGATLNITNCTFANNHAAGFTQGGGLNNNSSSNANLTNCIFWGNLANGSDAASITEIGHSSGTLTVINTIWQGNTSGGSILNLDPMFVNQAGGNLALTMCSPAIDTGSTVAITQDVLAQPRPFNAKPGTLDYDLGAYEFQNLVLVPEMDVLGNSVSIANGDVTPSVSDFTDFGTQMVCSGIINRTFVIFNNGSAVLNLSSFTISGTNAADFTITATAAPTVNAPNGSTSFMLTFNPSGSGVRTATITIQNDDCNEAPYTFAVQGTGLDPEINVFGNAMAIPDGDPAPTTSDHTDFSTQSTCSGAFNRTFTIQNSGNTTLNIASLTIGGPNASDFTVVTPPASGVLALNSTTFTIAFNPSANGVRTASVFINNDDCNESIFDFAIQGTGIDPEVNITGNNNTIVDGDVTPAVNDFTDFMAQSVCNGTVVRTFTIQNTGSQTLNISGVAISGTHAIDFTVTAAPAASIVPAGSTTFQVTFNPSNFGNRNATVTVSNSDCNEASYDFAITGFGTNVTWMLVSQTNISCNGGATGAATISASGGISPYFYDWSPGSPTGDGSPSVSGLTAGTWTCTVSDFNGCTYSAPITITSAAAITSTPSQTDVTCFGAANGTASVVVSGGNPGYTYSWSPSGGTGSSASGLSPGIYTVTITDATLCTATQTFNITEPTPLILNTGTRIDVTCNGGSDGGASVIASGGVGGNTFDWSPGNPTGDGTNTISGLLPGVYTCIVTNMNGCTASQTMFVTQPTPVVATTSQTSVMCNGGNAVITITGSGGISPYTGEGTFTVTAGTYTYTVTDASGCTGTSTVTVTEPTALAATSSAPPIACNGGQTTVTVTATGGIAPYTGEGTFTVTAGTYTYTITDANGCSTTTSLTVTEPTAFSPSAVETDITCFGGSDGAIDITVTGGTLPYTYDWNNGMYTTEDLTGLSAGTYTIVLTDANGCTLTGTMAVVQPSQIAHNGVVTDASGCTTNDGMVDLTTLGGISPYTFVWSTSATSEDISGLDSGMYSVIITDSNNCTASATFTITEPGSPAVTYSEPIDTACGGTIPTPPFTLSGEAPAGGTWTGPGVSGNSFDASLANIGMNVIIYSYTDAGGCSGSASDSIWVDLCMDVNTIAENTFSMYPNPTSGLLNIITNGDYATIVVTDALGQQVMGVVSNSTTTEIDLSDNANGLYFVRVEQNGIYTTQRVMIAK